LLKEKRNNLTEVFSLIETENTLEAIRTQKEKALIRKESYKIHFENKGETHDAQKAFKILQTQWQKTNK
jgi:RNase P/RNase MRP subunit p29